MFEVNPELKVKIEKVRDITWESLDNGVVKYSPSTTEKMVFIIDDFYKNPDEVREYAINSKTYTDEDRLAGAIGRRVWEEDASIMIKLRDNLSPVFEQLAQHPNWHIKYDKEHFHSKWNCMRFVVNVTNNKEIVDSGRDWGTICHIDGPCNKWASLIFLNTDDECEGGTSFYSVSLPNEDGSTNLPTFEYTCNMKYNRCIMYDANQVHGAIMEPHMFKTCDRLTQIMFF
jgi:hypothetical protein